VGRTILLRGCDDLPDAVRDFMISPVYDRENEGWSE
jgi:hypothetical protein